MGGIGGRKKNLQKLETALTPSEIIDKGVYSCSSTRRAAITWPTGSRIFDEGDGYWYVGDGSTAGGIKDMDVA